MGDTVDRNDYEQLKQLVDEENKIKEKIQIAQDHGATQARLSELQELAAGLKAAIADAALAAAANEIREASGVAHTMSKPAAPSGGASGGPSGGASGSGGGQPSGGHGASGGGHASGSAGGGSGSGSTSHGGGGGGAGHGGSSGSGAPGDNDSTGAGGGTGSQVKPNLVYVKGEHSVWGWDPYSQRWVGIDLTSPLVLVKTIPGGVLAIAEHAAAIFDAKQSEWLDRLDVTPETLTGGDGVTLDSTTGGSGSSAASSPAKGASGGKSGS